MQISQDQNLYSTETRLCANPEFTLYNRFAL